jgi:hypothetical protein
MFSRGNVRERARMGAVQAAGETVVDLFCGAPRAAAQNSKLFWPLQKGCIFWPLQKGCLVRAVRALASAPLPRPPLLPAPALTPSFLPMF